MEELKEAPECESCGMPLTWRKNPYIPKDYMVYCPSCGVMAYHRKTRPKW